MGHPLVKLVRILQNYCFFLTISHIPLFQFAHHDKKNEMSSEGIINLSNYLIKIYFSLPKLPFSFQRSH